jgi:hypothetical protein
MHLMAPFAVLSQCGVGPGGPGAAIRVCDPDLYHHVAARLNTHHVRALEAQRTSPPACMVAHAGADVFIWLRLCVAQADTHSSVHGKKATPHGPPKRSTVQPGARHSHATHVHEGQHVSNPGCLAIDSG